MSELDTLNQHSYSRSPVMDWLASQSAFVDAGERAAYWRIADSMRGRPILDLGVGPGRTIGLLRSLSADYVAIDYVSDMVERAKRAYPLADVRLGDARDLSSFADSSFEMVVFSYSGIDSIDHEGRRSVIAEARRVLRPGGVFWFSTLNLDGPATRYSPWRPPAPRRPSRPAGWVRYGVERALSMSTVPRCVANYRHGLRLRRSGDGWAMAPFFSHQWEMVTHYTTLEREFAELSEAGFSPDFEVYEDGRGARVQPGEALAADAFCFNILARR